MLVVALLVPLLAGCAMNRVATFQVTSPAAYTLDTGDVVRVTVYGDATLSTNYTVTDKESLNIHFNGLVTARGQTIISDEKQITERRADGYMVSPKV